MKWLWKPFTELQEALEEDVGPGDVRVSTPKSTLRPQQINDHVYEVHKPAGKPSVEFVFFHGLQLEPGASEEAHMNTWISRDKAECWLSWLLEDYPEARILTISYDAAARTTKSEGRLDMYITSENLVYSLTGDAVRVGHAGCPVVLVGHCLGGLVMKELCCKAYHMIRLANHDSQPVENFLANVKGLFFYATPHHGSLLADANKTSLKAPLIEVLRSLEVHTARRNEDFRQLRLSRGWKTFGVVGLLPVKLKLFEGIVVPEASARSDMDYFYAASVDHFHICRPVDKHSSTYQLLSDFARQFVDEWRQTQEVQAWTILDDPHGSGGENSVPNSDLSPRLLWLLRAVRYLLEVVHFIAFPYIFFWTFNNAVSADVSQIPSFTNDMGQARVFTLFTKVVAQIVLAEALLVFSAAVTPLACVYLLRFCITRRWAHIQELLSEMNMPRSQKIFLDLENLWWTRPPAPKDTESELEEGSRGNEDSKLEVGRQRQEDSTLGVGSPHQEDVKREVEPLVLEQRVESEVEVWVEVQALRSPLEIETKVDVEPSLVPSKETRRLRSRGPNTNKVAQSPNKIAQPQKNIVTQSPL